MECQLNTRSKIDEVNSSQKTDCDELTTTRLWLGSGLGCLTNIEYGYHIRHGYSYEAV